MLRGGKYYKKGLKAPILLTLPHNWSIRQESIDLLQVNLGWLSQAVLQSFMPVRAPKGKHKQQGHVLSGAVFVATGGLSANIYMANTMMWKGAKETKKGKNIVAIKVLFPLFTAMVKGQKARGWQLTCCKQQNTTIKCEFKKPVWVYTKRCLSQWEDHCKPGFFFFFKAVTQTLGTELYKKGQNISGLNFSLAAYSYFAINASLFIKVNDFLSKFPFS